MTRNVSNPMDLRPSVCSLAEHHLVTNVWREETPPEVWINLAPGHTVDGEHFAHAETETELLTMLKRAEVCECERCNLPE